MATQGNLDQWDDFVGERYDPNRKTEDFRKFDESAPAGVREFYRENHARQTRQFVAEKKRQYAGRTKDKMGIWEAWNTSTRWWTRATPIPTSRKSST